MLKYLIAARDRILAIILLHFYIDSVFGSELLATKLLQ